MLYEQTKAFIHTMAMRFQGQAELEDLEQEGCLALYPAIDGYDPDRGVKLLTYAEWYIRQKMQHYIQMNGSSMRLSVREYEKVHLYKRLCNAFAPAQGSRLIWRFPRLWAVRSIRSQRFGELPA